MKKLIKTIGLNKDRAQALQEKATELIIKSRSAVKESEIAHFMIDNMLHMIDIDQFGMFIKNEKEENNTIKNGNIKINIKNQAKSKNDFKKK